jgi:WD40 repeat protein
MFKGHFGYIRCLINVSNNYFASGSQDGFIHIWDPFNEYYRVGLRFHHGAAVSDLAFIDKDNLLISTSSNGVIKICSLNNKIDNDNCIRTIENETGSHLFLPGGYVISDRRKELQLWDLKTSLCINRIDLDKLSVKCLYMMKDYRIAIVANYFESLTILDY